MTLACEDANSKLVDVVTVADEDRVGNNFLQITKLRFGQKAKLLFGLLPQGQDFEVEVLWRCCCLVEILKTIDVLSTLPKWWISMEALPSGFSHK